MKKLLVPVLLATTFAVSCKKDDKKNGNGNNNSNLSKYEILTSDKWKVTEASLDPDASEENINFLDGIDDCQKDNYYSFNTSGSITMDEGATKCASGDPQTKTDGSWTLNADTTRILLLETSITQGFGDLSADIVTFNETTLRLKKDTSITLIPGNPPLTGKFYATFTKVK